MAREKGINRGGQALTTLQFGGIPKMAFCFSLVTFFFVAVSLLSMCSSGVVAGIGMFFATTEGRSLASIGLSDLGVALGAAGATAFLIKFTGLCGVALESWILTKMFYCLAFAGLLIQTGLGIFTIVKDQRLSTTLEKAWFGASEAARDFVQKKESCCGFYDVGEDLRCAHLASTPCGDIVLENQSFYLKLSAGVLLATVALDVLLFLMGLYLSRVYYKKRESKLTVDEDDVRAIIRSKRGSDLPSKQVPVRKGPARPPGRW